MQRQERRDDDVSRHATSCSLEVGTGGGQHLLGKRRLSKGCARCAVTHELCSLQQGRQEYAGNAVVQSTLQPAAGNRQGLHSTLGYVSPEQFGWSRVA